MQGATRIAEFAVVLTALPTLALALRSMVRPDDDARATGERVVWAVVPLILLAGLAYAVAGSVAHG